MSKIYVVDDDPTQRQVLGAALSHMNWDVELYESAEKFLEEYKNDGGVLILDHYLDGLSGLELQKLLSLKDDPMIVIFVTCADDIAVAINALREGASDYFVKPVDPPDVVSSVASAIEDSVNKKSAKRYKLWDALVKYGAITWAMGVATMGVIWLTSLDREPGPNDLAGLGIVIGIFTAALKFYPVKRNGNSS